MNLALERVVACQDRIIEALDMRDADAIETAAVELAGVLQELAASGAVRGVDQARLDHALRQAKAARIRVNILSDWTRQRIDQLSEIRSGALPSYGNKGFLKEPA